MVDFYVQKFVQLPLFESRNVFELEMEAYWTMRGPVFQSWCIQCHRPG